MVEIREWQLDDVFQLRELLMHPYFLAKHKTKYLYPKTFFHTTCIIKGYQKANKKKYVIRAIMFHKVVCGFIQCEKKDAHSCEISYWLGHAYWNKGIMQKAVACMCQEAFQRLQVMSIFARVQTKNKASCKVLEKNHFHLEWEDERICIYRKFK